MTKQWILRSALNIVSNGKVDRKVSREFQRKEPEKGKADLAKECLTLVKKELIRSKFEQITTASASGCLFPFTLNGSLYRETCSIIYTHIPGNCNTSVCPVLYSGSSVDDPFVYWATCDRYNYEQKISIVSMPIVCGDLNGTLIKIPELNWILVQSKMWSSDGENYFNKSWMEFKEDIPTPSPIPEKTMNELTAAATTLATSDVSHDLPLTTTATMLTTSDVSSDLPISTLSPANNYSETTTSNMNQTNFTETTARAVNQTTLRYRLIARRYWRLRIEMAADDGSWYSTEYNSFKVFSEDDNYRIELKLYEVGASDLMDNMLSNQSAPFATYDRNAINLNYSNAFPSTLLPTTAPVGWWWDDNTTSTLFNDSRTNCLSSLNSYNSCWRNVKGQVIRFRQTRMYMQPIQQIFNVSY
ncbi:hypothetical protein HELRODRAFT_162810 [Helobdella robusta]|uniref:Fibrinogen C-terminal domain-containing protein n=1 Tax=Helobdella robusta TaxID=6412 RepID=T1ET72_HELRO|nr:hypothetical protein HELRODRAFT_162810 [Helobdella robusta]ESN99292.1 hypothetical protein HELRODRAFT_162810 [Helobdella robusta]